MRMLLHVFLSFAHDTEVFINAYVFNIYPIFFITRVDSYVTRDFQRNLFDTFPIITTMIRTTKCKRTLKTYSAYTKANISMFVCKYKYVCAIRICTCVMYGRLSACFFLSSSSGRLFAEVRIEKPPKSSGVFTI